MQSPLWDQLGFQGKNPLTDIRGGGLLAVENLACVFFFLLCFFLSLALVMSTLFVLRVSFLFFSLSPSVPCLRVPCLHACLLFFVSFVRFLVFLGV